MHLWRQYLEQFAEREGDVEAQIVVGSYHAAEIFGFLSLSLDRDERFRGLIRERLEYFEEGRGKAQKFGDCLVNASFTLYNHMNTLCHEFARGDDSIATLMQQVDERVRGCIVDEEAGQVACSAASLGGVFFLLSLMTLMLREDAHVAQAVRQVENRFAAGAERAGTEWHKVLNALYRLVEMMQLFVTLSDMELKDQVQQIASRFEEEDLAPALLMKLRNGFCRLFELGHLLTTHLDEILN